MNQIFEVRRESDNHLITTCIMRSLAVYLAVNRTAMMRTAGSNETFIVIPVRL